MFHTAPFTVGGRKVGKKTRKEGRRLRLVRQKEGTPLGKVQNSGKGELN